MNRKIIISETQLQRIVEGITEAKKKKKKKKDTTLCARGITEGKKKKKKKKDTNVLEENLRQNLNLMFILQLMRMDMQSKYVREPNQV